MITTELIQAQLSCASPGDVLVICRTAGAACRRPAPCDGCARVRVSPSTTAAAILEEIGLAAPRPSAPVRRSPWGTPRRTGERASL